RHDHRLALERAQVELAAIGGLRGQRAVERRRAQDLAQLRREGRQDEQPGSARRRRRRPRGERYADQHRDTEYDRSDAAHEPAFLSGATGTLGWNIRFLLRCPLRNSCRGRPGSWLSERMWFGPSREAVG